MAVNCSISCCWPETIEPHASCARARERRVRHHAAGRTNTQPEGSRRSADALVETPKVNAGRAQRLLGSAARDHFAVHLNGTDVHPPAGSVTAPGNQVGEADFVNLA